MNPTEPPDRSLMQAILDAWATLDSANAAPFYAAGANIFYDVDARYESWEQYRQGADRLLANYKAAHSTVNDAQVFVDHEYAWATATVSFDMTRHSGKHDCGSMRWTLVWKNLNGKWLIVHEHGSMPLTIHPESQVNGSQEK